MRCSIGEAEQTHGHDRRCSFGEAALFGLNAAESYSMVGKLIVHQPTRPQAIACMIRALDELRVKGIATTAPFHRRLLTHNDFVEGRVDTGFVGRTWAN